jgi:hypothetical protein
VHYEGPVGFGVEDGVRRVGRKCETRWKFVPREEGRILECFGVVRRLTERGQYRRRLFEVSEEPLAFKLDQPQTNVTDSSSSYSSLARAGDQLLKIGKFPRQDQLHSLFSFARLAEHQLFLQHDKVLIVFSSAKLRCREV